MSSRAANRHEASALRVEVAVLDHFGCKVSMHTLYVHAWNVGEPGETPQYVVVERENGESRVRARAIHDCGAIRNKNRSTRVMGANAKRLVSRGTGHCSIRRI